MGKILEIRELQNTNYVKPIEINYSQNGIKKRWEAIISHNSVSILLYHKNKDSFIIVKQLRPPVLNTNPDNGYMYELCAGIVDKELSLIQIAKEEILEECGYNVSVSNIKRISSFYTNIGISGSNQTLYYAEVDDGMKVSSGGGLEEEEIEVVYLELHKAKTFMFDEHYQKTPGMLMAFYWFFDNIKRV